MERRRAGMWRKGSSNLIWTMASQATAASGAAVLLFGCTSTTPRIDSVQQAGTIHVAAISISPWTADSVSNLQPQFPMSAAMALGLALPRTSISQNSFADMLSAGLQIGLPQSTQTSALTQALTSGSNAAGSSATNAQSSNSTSNASTAATATNGGVTNPSSSTNTATNASTGGGTTTSSTTTTNGSQSTTQTTTTQTAAGVLPPNLLPATSLPGAVAAPSGTVQIDPALTYTAATAIYQEVQLINSYVSDAALRYGYVPYVVRLQVSVQPYARNEPYDVYVDLGAFTRCRHVRSEQPAFVLPLFVSDDLETGQTSDAINIARQLALSLGGTTGNLALQAGASNLSDKLNAILGTDFNSLYSVTRAGDNVLQVRFGASRSPNLKTGYSMVTQSHYVTFMLLVDRSYAATDAGGCFSAAAEDTEGERTLDIPKRGPEVWITSYARLRQASTGKELPVNLSLRDQRALSIMSRFKNSDVTQSPESRADALQSFSKLLGDVAINATDRFNSDFCSYFGCDPDLPWGYVNALWTSIASVMDMSEYTGIVMDLPRTDLPGVDNSQTVFLSDDCKQAATASITVGGAFSPGNFAAFLDLDSTPKGAAAKSTLRVAATSVTQSTAGGPFVIHFPTLKPLNQLVQALASACPQQGAATSADAEKIAAARAKAADARAKELASASEAAVKRSAASAGPDKAAAAEAATKALAASRAAAKAASVANAAAEAAAASAPKNKVSGLSALLPGAIVTLQQKQPNIQSRWSMNSGWGPYQFQSVFFTDSTQPNTTVSVLAASDSIAADQTGSAKLRLFVSGGTDLTDVEIQIGGAMLAPATTTTPLPSGTSFLQSTPPYATLLVSPVPAAGQPAVLDVYLQGLIASRAVTIAASGRVNGKATPGSLATLVLPIVANAPAKTSTTP